MSYSDFQAQVFEANVRNALVSVQRVLDVDRSPKVRLAEDVDHAYVDKYKLADLLTNTTIVALMAVLEQLGLTKEVLQSIGDISKEKATTLRFSSSESCTFVKEEVVDEPLPFAKETQKSETIASEFGTSETTSHTSTIERIVKRVTKQYYKIETEWELSIYSGTDVENRQVIKSRKGATHTFIRNLPYSAKKGKSLVGSAIKKYKGAISESVPSPTQSQKPPPFPPKKEFAPFELSLTWLLQQIDAEELKSHFAIDTSPENAKTKTPSRNFQIQQAMSFFASVKQWTASIGVFLTINYQKYNLPENLHKSENDANSIFVPVIPLLVDNSKADSWVDGEAIESESKAMLSLPPTNTISNQESDLSMLSVADTTGFLNEQARTLAETQGKLQKKFPDPETNKLISSVEAIMCVLSFHIMELVGVFIESIKYIEAMLEKQLVAAIGKEINSSDLDKYMRYHNEKMFNPSPEQFCYTIRRPEHYPDGILSIEEEVDDDNTSTVESISTHVREVTSVDPIKVPLNAATTFALTGKTFLHGWLNHRFGRTPSGSIRLNARARQFSSFVLLVGVMTSQNHMLPKDAIILRNKDEIHIPLLLNEIPTATEFKDAIGSLSPEQQRFAKSFRSMQLDSSVLGVCIVQIKPQLEKLLGLPEDSLTKEMKLTEDLTELFVEYQVPSDLVSCDFDNEGSKPSVKDQVENVREHVKSVLDVIANQKKEQLIEQELKTHMAFGERFEDFCEEEVEEEVGKGNYQNAGPQICLQKQQLRVPRKVNFGSRSIRASSAALPLPPPQAAARKRKTKKIGTVGTTIMANAPGSRQPMLMQQQQVQNIPTHSDKSTSSQASKQKKKEHSSDTTRNNSEDANAKSPPLESDAVIFAAMPKALDRAIELHDNNAAIRSTTIKTANSGWTRIRQKYLLSKTHEGSLDKSQIALEKSRAFDLLDALSRSGSLDIPFSELHILICATHRFEKNAMETVIQDNINPIEKLEMSTLLMASTILGVPTSGLIRNKDDRKRLKISFPLLLGVSGSTSSNAQDMTTTTTTTTTSADDTTIADDCS